MPSLGLHIDDAETAALQRRLADTRWPASWPTKPWDAGTHEAELRRLVERWQNGFNWRAQEAAINALPSDTAVIGGHRIHYLRFDGERPDPVPLLLSNGWPSTFLEMVGLARRLSRPAEHGLPDEFSFTVIVPSIPGYTFSEQRPSLPADIPTSEIWHRLMTDVLGFDGYFAHGGDLGAGTTSRLAAAHPDTVRGVHLMAVGPPRDLDESTLTDDERDFLAKVARWNQDEGSYTHQQSTRPLTLAYGLSDSPVGLLAWIVEKYRAWSDCDGDLSRAFDDDFLLTQTSLYWFTNTIGTSFRPYYEYGRGVERGLRRVDAPTAIALFPVDIAQPPRSWAERTHNVVRYTRMPRGGHFAAVEEPQLLASDIADFVRAETGR